MTSLQASGLSRLIAITAGALVYACFLLSVTPAAGHALIQQNGTYVRSPAVNRMPDANDRDKMQQQQNDHDRIEAANAQRKLEITADSDKLLKMVSGVKKQNFR